MNRIALVLVTSLGLLLAACDDDEADPPTITMTADVTTVAQNEQFSVGWTVTDFNLKPATDEEKSTRDWEGPREGHLHLYVNSLSSEPILMTHDTDARITLTDSVDPGTVTLIARLHTIDHLIIEPQITDSLEITLTAP